MLAFWGVKQGSLLGIPHFWGSLSRASACHCSRAVLSIFLNVKNWVAKLRSTIITYVIIRRDLTLSVFLNSIKW